ncbi:DUF6040 family protein [Nitrincola sp. MINF-07-Sa-05]|uniref:DUF6040 family protein n=1 Tax=Nitrincola salilacus TaxID=3400273 RepID=UPI003917C524
MINNPVNSGGVRMFYSILLSIHILAGSAALIAAIIAAGLKTANLSHHWHRISGLVFVAGMLLVFVTAVVMTMLKPNLFLLLIAIFSVYLALTGWRMARNRRGDPGVVDWLLQGAMLLSALMMLGLGALQLFNGMGQGVTLLVFAGLSLWFSLSGLKTLREGGFRGGERIANHAGMMLGGTIATITAVLVVNVSLEPAFILWLAPTVLITPLIIWWKQRLLSGVHVRGM